MNELDPGFDAVADYFRCCPSNLAEQQRAIGPVRGVSIVTAATAGAPPAAQDGAAKALAERSGCLACHGATTRVVGPSLAEIAKRYAGDSGAEGRLAVKVRDGGQGVWGNVPMPPHPQLAESDSRALVRWVLTAR